MIPDGAAQLVRRSSGLLLDTNIPLLALVGELGDEWIEKFKRTRDRFSRSDGAMLHEVLTQSRCQVTTPHVLAEASNLLGQLPERVAVVARKLLLERIRILDERWNPAIDATRNGAVFSRLGTTDWAVIRLAADGLLVLTDDLQLAIEIERAEGRVLNFNHLRPVE